MGCVPVVSNDTNVGRDILSALGSVPPPLMFLLVALSG